MDTRPSSANLDEYMRKFNYKKYKAFSIKKIWINKLEITWLTENKEEHDKFPTTIEIDGHIVEVKKVLDSIDLNKTHYNF